MALIRFPNKPFVLQNWDIDFEFNPDCITITFPGLLVGYWSSEVLSKVASAIGKPLYTDSFTASMARISYARVLVETDVSQPLLDSIEMVMQQVASSRLWNMIGVLSFALNV